jgi:hypothetical protein
MTLSPKVFSCVSYEGVEDSVLYRPIPRLFEYISREFVCTSLCMNHALQLKLEETWKAKNHGRGDAL